MFEGRRFRTAREKLFFELFQRVRCWVLTLGHLTNANDFQAVVACDRALFEMVVDLSLLRFTQQTPEKMFAWDESAKLKACHAVVKHFTKRGIAVSAKLQPQVEFIKRNENAILADRRRYFTNKKGTAPHPARWTGNKLDEDAAIAQAATPRSLAWPVDLEEFYAIRYPAICLNLHGSGAAGIRFVQTENTPILGAEPMKECLDFAVRCAQLVMVEFGLFGATAKAAFEDCAVKRAKILATVLRHHDPSFGMSSPSTPEKK